MKYNYFLYFLYAAFLFCPLITEAQLSHDIIYLKNQQAVKGTITHTDHTKVTYRKTENPEGTLNELPMQEVLLLFKRNGEFMVPTLNIQHWVAGADPAVHQIITHQPQVLRAQRVDISEATVNYQNAIDYQSNQLDKREVCLILYQDGTHQMFAPVAEVVAALQKVIPVLDKQYNMGEGHFVKDNPASYMDLTEEEISFFREKALQKARDLGRYLNLISNRNETEEQKRYAIKAALNLFAYDSSQVEVSSVHRKIKQRFFIREYLERLRFLPYDKVELVWIKAQMVSRFRKGADGKYYGIITAQQLFRGFLENKIAYQDVTEKNIEIVLDQYTVFDEGIKKQRWDVFLSDISVQQTRVK